MVAHGAEPTGGDGENPSIVHPGTIARFVPDDLSPEGSPQHLWGLAYL